MSVYTVLMIIAIIYFVVMPSFKDRVMPVKKLLITPAIFMFLFYQSVTQHFLVNYEVIAVGMIAGITIGILLRANTNVKADKDKFLIWLPGNYLSLGVFILIFSVHFAIGYLHAVDPTYLTQLSTGEEGLLFLMSCISSIVVGANGVLYWKYLNSGSCELVFSGR